MLGGICWNDKYHRDFWRPWNAIPSWTPLLSAPYPERPSGHIALDTPALRVLQMFFGNNTSFGVTSSQFGGETRFFTSFSAPLNEIIEARIWAGLHFRTADMQSVTLGDNIVNYMTDHYFQAVGNH
jgi:hypothetical protein